MSWKHNSEFFSWTRTDSKLGCQVSGKEPLSGLSGWSAGQVELPIGKLFAVNGFKVGPLVDAQWMQRGDDLSVTLPYTEDRPTGVECYWRLSEQPAGGCQVETWVSANTRLLDEQLQCSCESHFSVSQIQLLHIDANGSIENSRELEPGTHQFSVGKATGENQLDQEIALLCSLSDSDYQLLLAGYPGDQSEVVVDFDGSNLSLLQHLNFGFLEKGVIRRARLLAALLPPLPAISAEVDERLQAFYHSPLPLTV